MTLGRVAEKEKRYDISDITDLHFVIVKELKHHQNALEKNREEVLGKIAQNLGIELESLREQIQEIQEIILNNCKVRYDSKGRIISMEEEE